eukprot:344114_1
MRSIIRIHRSRLSRPFKYSKSCGKSTCNHSLYDPHLIYPLCSFLYILNACLVSVDLYALCNLILTLVLFVLTYQSIHNVYRALLVILPFNEGIACNRIFFQNEGGKMF